MCCQYCIKNEACTSFVHMREDFRLTNLKQDSSGSYDPDNAFFFAADVITGLIVKVYAWPKIFQL
jgi:hypothetical protein